jgi:hypothetical protein
MAKTQFWQVTRLIPAKLRRRVYLACAREAWSDYSDQCAVDCYEDTYDEDPSDLDDDDDFEPDDDDWDEEEDCIWDDPNEAIVPSTLCVCGRNPSPPNVLCYACARAHQREIEQAAYTHHGPENWEDGWETNTP